MLSNKTNRNYSDFFTSGFRAVANRARRRPVSMFLPSDSPTNPATTQKRGPRDAAHRPPRPSSMFMPSTSLDHAQTEYSPTDAALTPTTTPTATTTNTRRRGPRSSPRPSSMFVSPSPATTTQSSGPSHTRRSSIVSFSSRLFDRMLSASPAAGWPAPAPPPTRAHGDAELTEVYITAGGPYSTWDKASSDSHEDLLFQTIDPFAPSPDAKSFFIDLVDTPPPRTPKHESFLSFSNSPSDRSFLSLPRRERPLSVQTMPLPSRSQRSSIHHHRPPSRDKSDWHPWILEEESPIPTTPVLIASEDDENDPGKIDWHRFHLEVLLDDA